MTELLPIFPLGTVLLPGAPLALHIFEQRYRTLVGDLRKNTSRRWFGVVAIKRGSEVGESTPELYDVGCVAVVRRIEAYPDGRYDIVTVGGPRFALRARDDELPYLRAEVELLPEERGDEAATAAAAARAALAAYWTKLCAVRGENSEPPPTADGPLAFSYLAAQVLEISVEEKQSLLECDTAVARLKAATALLRRETNLLETLAAVQPRRTWSAGPINLN